MSTPTKDGSAMCPADPAPCFKPHECEKRRLCCRLLVGRPQLGYALHFVGFRPERFKDTHWQNVVKTFGQPDFFHRTWDMRARQEVGPNDVVVFATRDKRDRIDPKAASDVTDQPCSQSWDDSHDDIVAHGGVNDR